MSEAVLTFDSADLLEKGDGLRFPMPALGPHASGFVVRFQGKVYAYVNRCAHVPVELDWEHGKFFNMTQEWLICATHGAMYSPQNGRCIVGPCQGKSLSPIPVSERDGIVTVHLDQF
ncbi:Rieske (2Fe-2S) protein [Methylophilus flavus]|uniref:Rieske (2Fe-2S) protein n=1 Tax=Methylophilus flavus TaxID=640084 RepID=A0ABW3P8H6_9PROT